MLTLVRPAMFEASNKSSPINVLQTFVFSVFSTDVLELPLGRLAYLVAVIMHDGAMMSLLEWVSKSSCLYLTKMRSLAAVADVCLVA